MIEIIRLNGIREQLCFTNVRKDNPTILWVTGGRSQRFLHSAAWLATHFDPEITAIWWMVRSGFSSDQKNTHLMRYVERLLTVSEFVRDRLGQHKIFLASHCLATLLAIEAISRNPELYHAYIGIGQLHNIPDSGSRNPDLKQCAQLDWKSEIYNRRNSLGISKSRLMLRYISATGIAGIPLLLYPTTRHVHRHFNISDEYTTPLTLEIPVFILQGRYDTITVSGNSENYFRRINAPAKTFFWFERSAHYPFFEEPEKFHRIVKLIMNYSLLS